MFLEFIFVFWSFGRLLGQACIAHSWKHFFEALILPLLRCINSFFFIFGRWNLSISFLLFAFKRKMFCLRFVSVNIPVVPILKMAEDLLIMEWIFQSISAQSIHGACMNKRWEMQQEKVNPETTKNIWTFANLEK